MSKVLAVVCLVAGAIITVAGFTGLVRAAQDAHGYEHAPACGTAAAAAAPEKNCVLTLSGVVVARRTFQETKTDPNPAPAPFPQQPAIPPPAPPVPQYRLLPAAAAERVLAARESVTVHEIRVWLLDTTIRKFRVSTELYDLSAPGTPVTVDLWRDHPLMITVDELSLKLPPPEQYHLDRLTMIWAGFVLLACAVYLKLDFLGPFPNRRYPHYRREFFLEAVSHLAIVMCGAVLAVYFVSIVVSILFAVIF
ncbi:hypothetical protein [Actinocorallia longicatena]|uniref:Uncharacterized protein n=1 Tax=Actinocorallia longicatena TaxID=111803 RepID=A0ABP6PZP0_9ACTN